MQLPYSCFFSALFIENEERAKPKVNQGIIERMNKAREFYKTLLQEMNKSKS
jgi:hypothetical protein